MLFIFKSIYIYIYAEDVYIVAVFQSLSYLQLFMTPFTVAPQDPLSMRISRQEYQSGLPFSPPGDLPGSGIECMSHVLAGRFFTTEPPRKWSEVKVAQSCPTLCDPVDYTVHGILQARILEWGAFPFSRGSSQPRDRTQVSRIANRFFTR